MFAQCLAKSSPHGGPSAGAEVARFYGSGTFGAFRCPWGWGADFHMPRRPVLPSTFAAMVAICLGVASGRMIAADLPPSSVRT